jgi:hypothetical protein
LVEHVDVVQGPFYLLHVHTIVDRDAGLRAGFSYWSPKEVSSQKHRASGRHGYRRTQRPIPTGDAAWPRALIFGGYSRVQLAVEAG